MALVVPNAGETAFAENIVNKTAPENWVLKLFTNNVTPDETSTAATFTEASGNGYSAHNMTAANWTATAGNPTTMAYPEHTWTFTGALGNVYGYFIVGATSGVIKYAERFTNGPYNIQNNGDQIKVTPQFTID